MMMKKILVINPMGLYSMGGRAVIKGFLQGIHDAVPGVEITLMSNHYDSECEIYKKWNYPNVKVIRHIFYREGSGCAGSLLVSGFLALKIMLFCVSSRIFRKYMPIPHVFHPYDVVVDLTTDGPNDYYGFFLPLFSLYNIFLVEIVKKPVVISAASIGKFNNPLTKFFARQVLNRVNLIAVREDITRQYLHEIGIQKPEIISVADQAFLMEPVSTDRVRDILDAEEIMKTKPFVGISPSHLIHKYAFPGMKKKEEKFNQYVFTLKKFIDYVVSSGRFALILIPHSVPGSFATPDENDKALSREIYSSYAGSPDIYFLRGDYDSEEIKGIIGACELFVGFRMHSTIASTSLGIPTLAVVYGHKSHGIIGKMLGQEDCIIDITSFNAEQLFNELIEKFEFIQKRETEIHEELIVHSRKAKELARLNILSIKRLLRG
jgi:polysaccharide pyruvyl transferase WcaK-like protein